MKKSIISKATFAFVICLLAYFNANAHALWIDTNANGKKGTAQEVKIFYGEFATKEISEPSDWYSDLKNFKLWLVSPGGQKTQLEISADNNYYRSTFTPDTDGVYTLLVSHEAADLGGTTKYQFISSAYVSIGNLGKINATYNDNTLKVYTDDATTYSKGKPVKIHAVLNGEPLSNKNILVASPEGWVKEYESDENGSIEFIPLWSGQYMIEAQDYQEISGTHNGKDYSAAWTGSTLSLKVQ